MTSFYYRDASEADIPALIDLVTSTYRGEVSKQGWTTEADILDGQRIDAAMLQDDLHRPQSIILLAEERQTDCEPRLIACAHITVEADGNNPTAAYFGMFSVRPELQGGGIGRMVMDEAERLARERLGCTRMRMTVIDCRDELIAYYERRGYHRTGVKKPFPYGNPRYGLPKRDDLQFEVLEKAL